MENQGTNDLRLQRRRLHSALHSRYSRVGSNPIHTHIYIHIYIHIHIYIYIYINYAYIYIYIHIYIHIYIYILCIYIRYIYYLKFKGDIKHHSPSLPRIHPRRRLPKWHLPSHVAPTGARVCLHFGTWEPCGFQWFPRNVGQETAILW